MSVHGKTKFTDRQVAMMIPKYFARDHNSPKITRTRVYGENGKKVLHHDEVYKQYNEIYEYEDVSNKTNFNIGLALIIILFIVIICYYKYN